MRQLSKSKIISFLQCPKRVWLEIHRPELRDDSGSEMGYAIGNQVGDVARQIYDTAGNGRLIDVDEIGWEAAYEQTEMWLAGTPAPLFEAALRMKGALALADVMLPVETPSKPARLHGYVLLSQPLDRDVPVVEFGWVTRVDLQADLTGVRDGEITRDAPSPLA